MEEIKKFLNELLDENTRRLADIDVSINDLDIKIKENARFSEILKKENEAPFSEFSPRNISNKNLEEVKKLDLVNDELDKELHFLRKEKINLQSKNDRIITMLAELEEYNPIPKSEEKIIEKNNKDSIRDSLDNIISFLPSDPMRAKIELANLRNNL